MLNLRHSHRDGSFTEIAAENVDDIIRIMRFLSNSSESSLSLSTEKTVLNESRLIEESLPDAVLPEDVLFSDMVDRYFSDKVEEGVFNINSATYKKYTGYMCNVVEVVGRNTTLKMITPPMVMDIRNALMRYPVRRFSAENKRRNLQDLMNDPAIRAVKRGTAIEYFDRFKSVLDHACVLGYISSNPAQPVKISRRSAADRKSEVTRRPFSNEDLIKILNGYVYHGTTPIRKRVLLDAFFWAPLIAMYTGMRISEICQLRISDIVLDGYQWHGRHFNYPYIRVSDECESQSLKNINAHRKIPIPKKIIEIGFLEYIEERRRRLKNSENSQLFDGMRYESHSKWGRVVSRWFNGDGGSSLSGYKNLVLNEREVQSKCFHSFRHTFIDILRNTLGAENGEAIIAAIVGHEHGTSTNHYGDGYELALLKESIDRVSYSDEVERLVSTVSYEKFKIFKIKYGRIRY